MREIADQYRAVILQEACNVFETENLHEIQMFEEACNVSETESLHEIRMVEDRPAIALDPSRHVPLDLPPLDSPAAPGRFLVEIFAQVCMIVFIWYILF